MAPGVDVGNLVCATRLCRFCVRFAPAIVKCTFKSGNEMVDCAVPMGLVIWRSWVAVCSVMAASILLISAVLGAVVV